jgi:hypothetical protein
MRKQVCLVNQIWTALLLSYPNSAQTAQAAEQTSGFQSINALWARITAAVRVCKGIGCTAMPMGDSVLSAHQENVNTPSVASMSVEQVHIGAFKLAHGVLQQRQLRRSHLCTQMTLPFENPAKTW